LCRGYGQEDGRGPQAFQPVPVGGSGCDHPCPLPATSPTRPRRGSGSAPSDRRAPRPPARATWSPRRRGCAPRRFRCPRCSVARSSASVLAAHGYERPGVVAKGPASGLGNRAGLPGGLPLEFQGRRACRPTCSPADRRRWTDKYASGPPTASIALTVPWAGERRPAGPAGGPGHQGSARPDRRRPPPAHPPRRCGGARCDRRGRAGPGWPAAPPHPAATAHRDGHRPQRGWPGRPEGRRQVCRHLPIPPIASRA